MPRAGVTSDRVVAAASELVDQDGLDALSLARVAAVFGIATPSLYKHVPGLPALRDLVSAAAADELAATILAATGDLDGAPAVRAAAHAYRAWALAHPGRYELLLTAPAPDSAAEVSADALLAAIAGPLAGLHLSGDAALHAIRLLRSALHGFVDLERRGGFGLPLSTDATFAMLVDGLITALPRTAHA
ncbi:TetR/AcrR family transcriptional regulator [Microbacterium gorillae]|uniref:TetR/AcrR family transcriptional regulator n=1 Tax=Microbacterium gorillae TaxID=1231063 RepID=UPI00058F7044|nr:TetR-like C-terminal domain-containing protein [Microbacterium gorillae]